METTSNIASLVTFLNEFKGNDITNEKRQLIEYLIKTSEENINELLNMLAESNISTTINNDIYKYFKNLINYHGFENNNFNTLYEFLKNKETLGVRLNEVPVCKDFSLIDLASERMSNNRSLVINLINTIGSSKNLNRGKCEILISLLFHNAKLVNTNTNETQIGDVIIDGECLEVKCCTSKYNNFVFRGLCDRSGKLGMFEGNHIYNEINMVLNELNKLMNFQETQSVSLNLGSKNVIDNFLLNNSELSRDEIISIYKKVFLSFFSKSVFDFVSERLDAIIEHFVGDRSLEMMKSDGMIVSPNDYDRFKKTIGCLYLTLYHHHKKFKNILITSLTDNEDKSVYLTEEYLKKSPLDLCQDILQTGLDFSWPRLDKSAGRSVIMGALVTS